MDAGLNAGERLVCGRAGAVDEAIRTGAGPGAVAAAMEGLREALAPPGAPTLAGVLYAAMEAGGMDRAQRLAAVARRYHRWEMGEAADAAERERHAAELVRWEARAETLGHLPAGTGVGAGRPGSAGGAGARDQGGG